MNSIRLFLARLIIGAMFTGFLTLIIWVFYKAYVTIPGASYAMILAVVAAAAFIWATHEIEQNH